MTRRPATGATASPTRRSPATTRRRSRLRTASFAVFDDAAAELALLTQANLGPAFQPDLDSADQVDDEATAEEVATGCDADTAFEDQFDPTGLALGTADIDYLLIDDARLMVVTSDVRSFGDENTAQAAFDALYEAIGECTHFEAASEDGLESTVIDVAIDTETATEDVDDQFDMTGGGAWTFDGQEIPLGVGFSIARIDNNITMVMLLSIGVPEDSELLAPYTEIAADRLAAVRPARPRRRSPLPSPSPRRRSGPRSTPCPARSPTSTPPPRGSSATTDQRQASGPLSTFLVNFRGAGT